MTDPTSHQKIFDDMQKVLDDLRFDAIDASAPDPVHIMVTVQYGRGVTGPVDQLAARRGATAERDVMPSGRVHYRAGVEYGQVSLTAFCPLSAPAGALDAAVDMPPALPDIPQDIRDRVARGAAWLDEHEPGWVDKIDLDRLDLQSGCGCILGQLETAVNPESAGYWEAVSYHELTDDETTALGFNASWLADLVTNRADYPRLTEAWRQLITARRAEVADDA